MQRKAPFSICRVGVRVRLTVRGSTSVGVRVSVRVRFPLGRGALVHMLEEGKNAVRVSASGTMRVRCSIRLPCLSLPLTLTPSLSLSI